MRKQVSTFFSRAGNTYSLAADVQREASRRVASRVAGGEYRTILDLGCGDGALVRELADNVAWRRYIALDVAPGMLEAFAAPRLRGGGDIVKLMADGENVPLRPQSVDLLLSASAMQWYRQPERSLRHNMELLRPGGTFSLCLFVRKTLAELAEVSAQTHFGSVLNLRPAREYSDILAAIPGVSFQAETVETLRVYPSVREFLAQLKRTGATCTAVKRAYTRKAYAAFCKRYVELHSEGDGVRATYRITHLWGRKH